MSTNVQTFPGNVEIGGNVSGNGSGLTELNADNITTGELDYARLPPTPFLKGGNAYISSFGSSNDRPFPIIVGINVAFSEEPDPIFNNTSKRWKILADGLYYIKITFTNNLYYVNTNTGQPTGGGNGANFKVFLNGQELIATGGTGNGSTSTNNGYFSLNKDQFLSFALNVPFTIGTTAIASDAMTFLIYKI